MPLTTSFNTGSTPAINALNAIVDALDIPSGTFPAQILLYGSGSQLLASHDLPNPAFQDATYNTTTRIVSVSPISISPDLSVDQTGKALYYVAVPKGTSVSNPSAPIVIFGGPVIAVGSAIPATGAVQMPTVDLVAGVKSEITSFSLQMRCDITMI